MKKSPAQPPKRFQDPLNAYIEARASVREQSKTRLANVDEVYEGWYGSFAPQDEEGKAFLGGPDGIVGTKLAFRAFDGGIGVLARDGRCVALLDEVPAARLSRVLEAGWTIHALLAYTVYCVEDKSFTGHFACVCYDPKLDARITEALEAFVRAIAERIASGATPQLDLSQEQFVRVVESKGSWYLTRDLPLPKLPEGSVFYRRRRTFNDRLVSAGLEGNKGCLVASWTGTALIALALLALVWWIFF
jgi:hypothetical protein